MAERKPTPNLNLGFPSVSLKITSWSFEPKCILVFSHFLLGRILRAEGTKETGAGCPVGRGRESFTEEDIFVLLLKDEPLRAFWKQGPRLGIGVGQEIRWEGRLGTDREGLHVLCRVWTLGHD